MALRSEVRQKDNSKLGRVVLNNRLGQQKVHTPSNDAVSVKETPKKKVVAKKKPVVSETKRKA